MIIIVSEAIIPWQQKLNIWNDLHAYKTFLSLVDISNEDLKVSSGNGGIEQLKRNTTLEKTVTLLANIHDTIVQQAYFAMYYDNDPFYIRKITKVIDERNVKMKCFEKVVGNFCWPKREKWEINIKYFFYRPVILIC